MKLEVCIDAIESARTAQAAGAQRLELCAALNIGGITPSHGLLKLAADLVGIEKVVMIRPRSGGFVYTDGEIETMAQDIEMVRSLGFKSIVMGVLLPNGRIDLERMAYLMSLAGDMSVVFHRAIDVAYNPEQDIPGLIDLGVRRLLTSGQQPSAIEGAERIRALQARFGQQITIMPGAGITPENLPWLRSYTKCTEFHMSAKTVAVAGVSQEDQVAYADFDKIQRARLALQVQ